MKNLKKLMAILLCLVMVMSMLPMSVFAEDSTTPGGSVTITPKTATVTRGEELQFTAVATPEEGYPMGHLEWSVTEVGGVSINDAGLLVVAATVPVDTALTVTVEAYCGATADTSVLFATDTATVTVTAPAPVYTITFDANGGDALTPNSGTTDTAGKLASLPTPTHSDPTKTFVGWFDASEGGNAVTGDTVYVADTTVYAQWETNYIITDGADSTYQNTITQLVQSIKVNAPIEKFTGVTVDGVKVAEENYTAVSGSTIITFTEAYLKSLSAGEHAVSILFEDDVVSTKLTTKGAPELYVGGVGMVSGECLDTTGKLSFTAPADNYAYYKDGVLTLKNYTYSGAGYEYDTENGYCAGIYRDGDLKIVLSGDSAIGCTSEFGTGIYTTANLTVEEAADGGSLAVTEAYNGIFANGAVSVNSGSMTVKSTANANEEDYWALNAEKGITIASTLSAQASTEPDGSDSEAYDSTKNATYDWVEITPIPTVTLDKTSLALKVGETAQLTATVADYPTEYKKTWSSDADSVATVDEDGKVTAVGAGTAHIVVVVTESGNSEYVPVALEDEVSAVCTVTVTERYDITFDVNGGDALDPATATANNDDKLETLPTPTYKGKEFLGWFTAKENGTKVTVDTVFTEDTTIYAQWKTPEIYVGGVGMYSGEYLEVGATAATTTKPADRYAYYNEGTLTLHNYTYTAEGFEYAEDQYAMITKDGALTLVLEGTNSLIYSGELAVRGVHVVGLTVNGTGALEVSDTDIGLNSTKDITVESGTVIAEAEMVALAAKNKVSITGGRVLAKSTDTESDDQYYALYSQDATIDISDTLYAQASTGPNGFNPVPYEKSKNTTYDWVKIGQAPEIWVGGVGMESGDYLNDAGALSLTEPAGGYAHYEDGVLTLSSYTYFGDGYEVAEDSCAMIYKKGALTVVTVGYNKLSGTEGKDVVAVLAEGAVTMQGEGTVALISKDEGISAQGDITINSGEVTIDTGYDGLSSDEGDVVIKGGTVTITAEGDGIWTTEGGVTLAGGTVDITAEGDAICVYDSSVTISGGTLTAAGGTDGIYAAETISITAGDVLVKSVNEEEDDYFSALYADEIDIAATLTALASEVPEGTDPELFDLDKFDSYDWVRIGSASEVIAVKLSRTALTMNVGGTEDLTATVLGKADGYAPVWTSSDPAVATVDENGKVTAVSVGEAVITATLRENGEVLPADMDDEISDSCTVTVTDEPTTFIEVNKVWAGSLADGESHPGSVTVYLTKNGERVADGKAVLSAGNNWTYTWNNLPAKDSDGSAVKYGVEEETVYGYTAEIKQGSTANYFTITNTVVPKEAVTHTVKYDANGGKGTMSSDTVDDGEEYTLRTNKFTAPKGKVFKCWKIGTKVYSPGEKITVEGDVTVKAVWKTKTDVPQTGDSGEIVLWGAVLGVSVAALAVIGVVAWKKKKDQE